MRRQKGEGEQEIRLWQSLHLLLLLLLLAASAAAEFHLLELTILQLKERNHFEWNPALYFRARS